MKSHPNQKLPQERINKIYKLLTRIGINQSAMQFIRNNELSFLKIFNEALTHTSTNSTRNHERLEFLGDAVLRLAASEYIQEKFPSLSVGDRSALRAQIVSDAWLAKVGEKINIKEIMLIGPKAMKDKAASSTLQAEATEALIGAIYECLKDINIINNWLTPHWNETSKNVLADPHRLNSKSALQEWSQSLGYNKPRYEIKEISQAHGDLKRFYCQAIVNKNMLGEGWGSSRKQAEKEAAREALTNLEST